MPVARKYLVDDSAPGCFNCISRCVRRAFLCGNEAEHRRDWVRDAIRTAAAAVDVLAYAAMSNHLHLVVRTDPQRVTEWAADTVTRRWAIAHPRTGADGHPVAWSEPNLAARPANAINRHRREDTSGACLRWNPSVSGLSGPKSRVAD